MKKYWYRILILLACGAIFSAAVFPQKKNSDIKKTVSPAPPKAEKMQLSKLELEVVDELNEARKNPKKYVEYLGEQRKALKGNVIRMPNQSDVRTIEGAAAIDEAVGDLKVVADLDSFQVADGLNRVARAQLTDLQGNSKLGHLGKDGSDLKTRMARFGTATGKSGENISHRANTARDVVSMFLVDDGVKNRSHRKAVLSRNFKLIGAACGTGKNAESLCVVVFADAFKEKTSAPGVVEF